MFQVENTRYIRDYISYLLDTEVMMNDNNKSVIPLVKDN